MYFFALYRRFKNESKYAVQLNTEQQFMHIQIKIFQFGANE